MGVCKIYLLKLKRLIAETLCSYRLQLQTTATATLHSSSYSYSRKMFSGKIGECTSCNLPFLVQKESQVVFITIRNPTK